MFGLHGWSEPFDLNGRLYVYKFNKKSTLVMVRPTDTVPDPANFDIPHETFMLKKESKGKTDPDFDDIDFNSARHHSTVRDSNWQTFAPTIDNANNRKDRGVEHSYPMTVIVATVANNLATVDENSKISYSKELTTVQKEQIRAEIAKELRRPKYKECDDTFRFQKERVLEQIAEEDEHLAKKRAESARVKAVNKATVTQSNSTNKLLQNYKAEVKSEFERIKQENRAKADANIGCLWLTIVLGTGLLSSSIFTAHGIYTLAIILINNL